MCSALFVDFQSILKKNSPSVNVNIKVLNNREKQPHHSLGTIERLMKMKKTLDGLNFIFDLKKSLYVL